MSFLDDVTDASNNRFAKTCTVIAWRDAQDTETQAEFDAAVADPLTSSTAIWKAMKIRGFKRESTTVRRHRRGECACPSQTM